MGSVSKKGLKRCPRLVALAIAAHLSGRFLTLPQTPLTWAVIVVFPVGASGKPTRADFPPPVSKCDQQGGRWSAHFLHQSYKLLSPLIVSMETIHLAGKGLLNKT